MSVVAEVGVGQAVGLDQPVGDVDPETVDPTIEPESQDVLELGPYVRVGPVEVGLGRVEQVQVPLAETSVELGDPRPCRSAEQALPVVGSLIATFATIAEDVSGALRAAGRRCERCLEPRVLV